MCLTSKVPFCMLKMSGVDACMEDLGMSKESLCRSVPTIRLTLRRVRRMVMRGLRRMKLDSLLEELTKMDTATM